MSRTNKEDVLDTIWAASPKGVTNGEIRQMTGISSHQQVYMLTRELAALGWIQSRQDGREWVFWVDESVPAQLSSPGGTGTGEPYRGPRASETFVARAREAMSAYLGVPLAPGVLPGVPRRFELVSADRRVAGSTLYTAPVQRQRLPLAKFSLIGERVWLLEKTSAESRFLVFGHDRVLPLLWLKRYGHLAPEVHFFYLDENGRVEELD